MAPQDPHPEPVHAVPEAPTDTTPKGGPVILERRHDRRAARKRRRLISARSRRVLAQWLRRTAQHTQQPHPLVRRRQTLLHYRVAAVRNDLLEIAAMLERAHDPNPASVAALHELLADGCDSPLYNADIHISELRATLHYVRNGLVTHDRPNQPREPRSRARLDR
jgi:hypothetical protein